MYLIRRRKRLVIHTITSVSLFLISWPTLCFQYLESPCESSRHHQLSYFSYTRCQLCGTVNLKQMADRDKTPSRSETLANINLLTTNAFELQKLLTGGHVRSTELVELYLDQIERHNHQNLKLNAMISTTPRDVVLHIAEILDKERASGTIRSQLHGIPIAVKVRLILVYYLSGSSPC